MKILSLLSLLGLVANAPWHVRGDEGSNVDGFADPEECYSSIEASDVLIPDRRISPDEYVILAKLLGPEDFLSDATVFSDLPFALKTSFNILACLCQQSPADDTCCVGANAGLETAGAFAGETPTPEQQSYLFLVCSLTDTAIERVLSSEPPSPAPSPLPTMAPVADPTDAPTVSPTMTPVVPVTSVPTKAPVVIPTDVPSQPPTSAPVVATDSPTTGAVTIEVKSSYDIAVPTDEPSETYRAQLIGTMDSVAPEVLSEVRRQLRHGRRLQTAQIPTSIDELSEINCPPGSPDDSRCATVTSQVNLVFQPNAADPEGSAAGFGDDLDQAIADGDFQKTLDSKYPENNILILDSAVLIPPRGIDDGGDDEDGSVGTGGIAGAVLASVAVLAVLVLLLNRRQPGQEVEQKPVEENREIDPAEIEGPDSKAVDEPEEKGLVGATAPVYSQGKDAMVDLDEDHPAAMSHDSSSNAGSSGWSSSAGVSSLNTGSADGLEPEQGGLAAIPQTRALETGQDSSVPNIPNVSRADLDSAIEAGDWAAVGATAALLAAASDSQSFSSHSKSQSRDVSGTASKSGSSVSSIDAARAAELDHLVDAGDWEGVVLAAAKYEAAESRGSVASDSNSRSTTEQKTIDSGTNSSKAQKRAEIRAVVEDLVRRVVPEEIQNVDEMMLQFRGREEELVETLRTMQERAVAQKARQGAQKEAKRQAKAAVATQRAASATMLAESPAKSSSSSSKGSSKSGSQESPKRMKKDDSGSFPASSSRSLGTGQVTATASSKSLGTGKIEGPAKSKSLGTGLMAKAAEKATPEKPTSQREKKQSALEMAIEAGDWEAVGEAAAMLSDHSMASSADSEEINRIAEGASSQGSLHSRTSSQRADELDDLIEQGDWTGVVKAASSKSANSTPNSKEDSTGKKERRQKKLDEEQEALAQAEIWMAIAEQSKQDGSAPDQAASEAADWAIARSLNALNQKDQTGTSDEDANSPPQLQDEDNDQEEV